jgi:dTMP kinase
MDILPNFIVFEGGDGSGTTTQLHRLGKKAAENGLGSRFFPSFEPTNSPLGTMIRSALSGETELLSETLALLFAADRNEHLYGRDGIVFHCQNNIITACDRYVPSSLVYQGIACGIELPRLLNRHFPAPELLFYFDIEPEQALERIRNRAAHEIFEYREFQEKVRKGYRELLPSYEEAGTRVIVLDASLPIEELGETIWSAVKPLFDRPPAG